MFTDRTQSRAARPPRCAYCMCEGARWCLGQWVCHYHAGVLLGRAS
jgi:hypothetical protein